MSVRKLRAFLSAVEPDGTVVVHISRSGEVTPIESLLAATRRMDRAFGLCLFKAGEVAMSTDELDDMVDMSMRAVHWLQSCCLELRLAVLR